MEFSSLAVAPNTLPCFTLASPLPPVTCVSTASAGARRAIHCAIGATPADKSSTAWKGQTHHSKDYLERQAAILEVQQSPDLVSALHRFDDMLKVQDLNLMLRYFGKLKRFQDLSKLFEWMRQSGNISASSYTSYITFTGKSLNPMKSLEIYKEISEHSLRTNTYICNAVLSCLVRTGRYNVSIKVFQEMKKDGLKPDVVTYSTLLSGCIKAKDGYLKAREVVGELENEGLKMDGVIYGTLLAVCASNSKCEEAENYFQRMKDEGLVPNEFHYSSLLNAYSIDGNCNKAEQLVQEMKSAGLEPNKVILTTLLKAYVKGGLFVKSRELLAELESMGHANDEIPYCLLMDGLAKAGHTDEAKLIFKRIADKSVKSDGYAHSIMILAFCREGLLGQAKELAKDFEAKYNRYDIVILNSMLCAYCRVGDMESAMQTLKKMDELAISPDRYTFNILIKYFCKEGLYLLAYRTMQDMHSKGIQVDEGISSSLIFQLGNMKAYSEAFSVYNMLNYGKITMCKALHEKILHILVAGRLFKEAYLVVKDNVESISKPSLKKFATAFMKSGNVNLINSTLEVLHASGYKIDQEIFHAAVSRYIVLPEKKDLLLQLLQWMPEQKYCVNASTRELIMKNSHFFGGKLIKEVLVYHPRVPKAAGSYELQNKTLNNSNLRCGAGNHSHSVGT
ncbi:hypothetical protein SAY86_012154 [Trapa natans]|uniref:Pentatricopeptide repeat-containing protein n=1 Tax=Trapa natans TaxID=22666 RepID=A0AAN7LWP7_TRANT|nr:hypothetical protein SAY86_012154 [Trapa natans]